MAKSADAFRTISEVADWLGVQTHVLRFWESKFTQIKPVKRAGGRRYYRPADMLLLGGIRKLLHDDGLTIKGVQKILREEGMAHVADLSPPLDDETTGRLDSDLAPPIRDETGIAAAVPAPKPVDQAPIRTLRDGPFSADDTGGGDPGPTPIAPDAPQPAYMRAPDRNMPAGSGVEPGPAPTLTPDFGPFGDDSHDAPQAGGLADTPPGETPVADTPLADTPMAAASAPSPAPQPPVGTAPEATETPPPIAAAPDPAPMAAPVPEPVPEPPRRARIVHAPDEVDLEGDDIAPSALTRAVMLDRLTPQQRDALRPLVAQLTALRDQMARARHEPR